MAVSSLDISDEILAPAGEIAVSYTGKNPFKAALLAPKLLKTIMKISAKDLLETDVRWDINKDPRDFYGMWMGKRREDRWTITKIRIIIQGVQSSKDKTGWVTVRLKGHVDTKYTFSNFIQRSFWWFYNYSFYYKQRRNYLDYAQENIYDIRDKIKEAFDLMTE